MVNKIINITNHPGEIESGQSCVHHFDGGKFEFKEGNLYKTFLVIVRIIDEESNAVLKLNKEFLSKKQALFFLKRIIKIYPICEGVIREKSEKILVHYA